MQTNGALLFRDHVDATPTRSAFIFDDHADRLELSYADFHSSMQRVASGLSSLGLKPGDRILISAAPAPELLQAIYGAIRGGFTAVLCDPGLPAATARIYASDTRCAASVVGAGSGAFDAVADIGVPHRFSIGGGAGTRPFTDLLGAALVDLPEQVSPRHPAVAFSTSGSTGRPKTIIKTHEHFHLLGRYTSASYTASAGGPAGDDTRYLVATSLNHTSGLNAGVMLGLLRGWSGVIAGSFHPAKVLLGLARHRCSTVVLTPSQASALLSERELLQTLDFSALRSIRVGSGPSTPELLQRLRQALPQTEILNIYALTECAPCLGQPPGTRQPPDSCGRPWAGVQARVVDERAEETGEGELWLKSDLISGATVLDEDTIRERYIDGWLRTRDVFRVDDRGWYYFVGRVDDMFVCGGENVYPADLERLLATHPAVAEVCVTGLADQALGAVPAAAVVLRPDAHARPAELVAFVRDNAPVYLIPHRIEIVAALPVLGSGKVDRRRVRSLFEDLTASSPLPAAEASVRQQVAEVWAEVLKHEPADPDLSFLDAGGTSSLAVELVARLSALNLAVDVGDVFVKGSVNDLVNQILQERSARQRASTA